MIDRHRPWAAGRKALYPFLREREGSMRAGDVYCPLPSDDVRDVVRLPFQDLVRREELFATVVEPAVQDIDGHVALAPVLARLLAAVADEDDAVAATRLYQLLISQYRWNLRTFAELEELLVQGGVFERASVHEYFLWLVQATPDDDPAKFALWMLGRTRGVPPADVVRLFACHDRFCAQACRVMARWDGSEDFLIETARMHRDWGRVWAIEQLRSVSRAEHKAWLLSEGFMNGVLPVYTAYWAAVHGDLVGRMRAPELTVEELAGVCALLNELTCTWGPSDTPTMTDYVDGPEVCRHLLRHVEAVAVADARLFRALWNVLDWAESVQRSLAGGYGETVWSAPDLADIEGRCKACLMDSKWPEELRIRWQQISRSDSAGVEELEGGDLTLFNAVVGNAESPDLIGKLAEWSVEFLALNELDSLRMMRRQELEAIEMKGVCAGGIHGLTDPKLHSVYGQIVLRIVMSLEQAPGVGWPLLRAALESETKFHRECAAKTLARWPHSSVSPAIVAALAAARAASSDADAIAAIDTVLAPRAH